jgi:hypothetical protein
MLLELLAQALKPIAAIEAIKMLAKVLLRRAREC